jgi:hypothetical protein
MADLSDVAGDLEAVAWHLRRAGEVELRRELGAAITRGVKEVIPDIRGGLRPAMPDRYADTLNADLKITASTQTGGAEPRVTLSATTRSGRGRKLRKLEAGRLAHPLYGNREHWYSQPVRPDFFTGPCQDAAPRIRREIVAALNRVAERIVVRR